MFVSKWRYEFGKAARARYIQISGFNMCYIEVFGSNLLAVGAAAIEAIEYLDPILENTMPFL